MTLSPDRLSTVLTGRPFRYYDQVESTNDLAKAWLAEDAPSGAVVIADEQVKGRGRLGRSWQTPPGTAIAMSVILKPTRQQLPTMTQVASLSIAEMLDTLKADDVGIKWPNDVLLKGKKVAGILVEAEWQGDALRGVVIGMGVNVRVDFSGTELENYATSIEHALGLRLDRSELIKVILERITYWNTFSTGERLFNTWKARLTTLQQTVTVETQQGVINGLAEAVTPDGALLVRDDNGQLHTVLAGDIPL